MDVKNIIKKQKGKPLKDRYKENHRHYLYHKCATQTPRVNLLPQNKIVATGTNLFPSNCTYTLGCSLAPTSQARCWRTRVTQKSQSDNPLPPLGVLVNPSTILLSLSGIKEHSSALTISLCLFFIPIFSSFSLSLYVILFPFVIGGGGGGASKPVNMKDQILYLLYEMVCSFRSTFSRFKS